MAASFNLVPSFFFLGHEYRPMAAAVPSPSAPTLGTKKSAPLRRRQKPHLHPNQRAQQHGRLLLDLESAADGGDAVETTRASLKGLHLTRDRRMHASASKVTYGRLRGRHHHHHYHHHHQQHQHHQHHSHHAHSQLGLRRQDSVRFGRRDASLGAGDYARQQALLATGPSIVIQAILRSRRNRAGQLRQHQQQQYLDGARQDEQGASDSDSSFTTMDSSDMILDGLRGDIELYRRHEWAIKQQLLARTEAATRKRSQLLMHRRLSAGVAAEHAQTVARQHRREQESLRQIHRDTLDRKMTLAMARRNEYLAATIENDPSRRHRRQSGNTGTGSGTGNGNGSDNQTSSGIQRRGQNPSAPAPLPPSPPSFSNSSYSSSSSSSPRQATVPSTLQGAALHRQESNSQMRSKAGITASFRSSGIMPPTTSVLVGKSNSKNSNNINNNTPRSITSNSNFNISNNNNNNNNNSSSSTKNNINNNSNRHTPLVTTTADPTCSFPQSTSDAPTCQLTHSEALDPQLSKVTLVVQRLDRQRMIQKAAKEYMDAISGSHSSLLRMPFDTLAMTLQSNRPLIQATGKLLKYAPLQAAWEGGATSSALPASTAPVLTAAGNKRRPLQAPIRVFLSVYMLLAHPDHIRSSSTSDPDTMDSDSEASFQALIDSANVLLQTFQEWLQSNLTPAVSATTTATTTASTNAIEDTTVDTTSLTSQRFNQAWQSYYDLFQTWKAKDMKRLLETLINHARQIESLWDSVKDQPSAAEEWGPRIHAQRQDLKAKALQIGGLEGAARIETIFSSTPTPETPLPAITTTGTTVAPVTRRRHVTVSDGNEEEIEDSDATDRVSMTTAAARNKRSRDSSESEMTDGESSTPLTPSRNGTTASLSSSSSSTSPSSSGPTVDKQKPATKKKSMSASNSTDSLLSAFESPDRFSNAKLLHELVLDPNFKLEPKVKAEEAMARGGPVGLEALVRTMAEKAYFDTIRADAEKGQLSKWIPSLLTSLREKLLIVAPEGSSIHNQIKEVMDLELVQQQVDRNIYDVGQGLAYVLEVASKLCAPVRDPMIAEIRQGLAGSAGSTEQVVEVVKKILELLDAMALDMSNFRIMAMKPELKKQAVGYEQKTFREGLESGQTSLEITTRWLQKAVQRNRATATASTTTAFAPTSPSTLPSGVEVISSRRRYEILTDAVLELLFSQTPLSYGETLPETLALDDERLFRLQNELQAVLLVAGLLHLVKNFMAGLQDHELLELKLDILHLLEQTDTNVQTLSDKVVEAMEQCMVSAYERQQRSSSPAIAVPTMLTLTPEQVTSVRTMVTNSISFDNTLYGLLSKRLRTILHSLIVSSVNSSTNTNNSSLEFSDRSWKGIESRLKQDMVRNGLATILAEFEPLAALIQRLIRYNALVYHEWYDPILAS